MGRPLGSEHLRQLNTFMSLYAYLRVSTDMQDVDSDFISQRTREGLARCKAEGIVLGRPRGAASKLGLDDQAKKIDEYQALKLNKRAIAKLLGVSPNTLYS
jgi:DNA invertase Pin-like site-specific DNA recombinase